MKKKGFTLVELLAVIAIIAIIMVISLPELIGQMKTSKQDALNKVKDIIVSAARNYAIDYKIAFPASISVVTLCNNNYIDCPVNNPVDNTEMNGYIIANTKENYIYSITSTSYPITNLVTNGSFENEITGWSELDNSSISLSNQSYYGSHSLKLTPVNMSIDHATIVTNNYINFNTTHVYFAQIMSYSPSANPILYFPYTDPYPNSGLMTLENKWIKNSILVKDTGISNGTYSIRLDINNNGITTFGYYDGLSVIDLTDTFGVGNEPSKEWCDANIDYFDGTETIYVGS